MSYLALLGDSVFDNAAYVPRGDDVTVHVKAALPDWRVQLAAVDGAVIDDVASQLEHLEQGVTHLVVSVGGNDALAYVNLLTRPARSASEVLGWFADAADSFETRYRRMLGRVLARRLPTIVCTIYNGNLEREIVRAARTALAIFDDVIFRVALESQLPVIDLRTVCSDASDYATPIEPSGKGGRKIGEAIAAELARM